MGIQLGIIGYGGMGGFHHRNCLLYTSMFFRNGKKSAQDVSMNEPIDTDKEGNTLTLMDVMSTEDNIVDNLDIKIKSEQLKKYLVEVLTPRERIIIELRYGLNGSRPLTQREVAQRLKISRSYVSRIEKKALLTLRKRCLLYTSITEIC